MDRLLRCNVSKSGVLMAPCGRLAISAQTRCHSGTRQLVSPRQWSTNSRKPTVVETLRMFFATGTELAHDCRFMYWQSYSAAWTQPYY